MDRQENRKAISKEANQAEKGTLRRKKKCSAILTAAIPVFVVLSFLLCAVSCTTDMVSASLSAENGSENSSSAPITDVSDAFSGPLPFSVSGSMRKDVTDFPTLEISFENLTDTDILAVRFYWIPYDENHDPVDSLYVSNRIDFADTVAAHASQNISEQQLKETVKSGTLYVYGVYFDDRTIWGNPKASVSDIKEYAYKIEVE